jgi:hypothetical protein
MIWHDNKCQGFSVAGIIFTLQCADNCAAKRKVKKEGFSFMRAGCYVIDLISVRRPSSPQSASTGGRFYIGRNHRLRMLKQGTTSQ